MKFAWPSLEQDMSEGVCVNGMLNDTKYSAPMLTIGVLVAAATLMCLLLMLRDIVGSIRLEKPWLPCRWFALNSVTLTLLAFVTKIAMDLTTAMPRAEDQLSKLTGVAMICVSTGFLMPSIGISEESSIGIKMLNSETALSLLIVTIVTDTVTQLVTGVIFMFIVEHIISIFCMVVLVIATLQLSMTSTRRKDLFVGHHKHLVKRGAPSLLRRLEHCYLYGFDSDHQFVMCKDPFTGVVGIMSLVPMVVVIQAVVRSFHKNELKFCKGVSDYGFSAWLVVITQILMVVIGGCAVGFRWIAMSTRMDLHFQYWKVDQHYQNPLVTWSGMAFSTRAYYFGMKLVRKWLTVVAVIPIIPVYSFVSSFCRHRTSNVTEEDQDLVDGISSCAPGWNWDEWTISKGVVEMKRFMDGCKSNTSSLSTLLDKTAPSQQLHTLKLEDRGYLHRGIRVSILSMAILVKLCEACIPSTIHDDSLVRRAFGEALETLVYINDRVNFQCHRNKEMSLMVELVRQSRGIQINPQHDIQQVLQVIKEWNQKAIKVVGSEEGQTYIIMDELRRLTNFLISQNYSSVEMMYESMEQIAVDMFHLHFAQLPHVIYDELLESQLEEHQERVRVALNHVCKLEPIETKVQWSFPVESNISGLITPLLASTRNDEGAETTGEPNPSAATTGEPNPSAPAHGDDVHVQGADTTGEPNPSAPSHGDDVHVQG